MACRMQKRISLRRKLHILRALTKSQSVRRRSINKSSVLYIYKLKVLLERVKRECRNLIATRREYLNLLKHIQEPKEVKVEKVKPGTFVVRIRCASGGDKLVAILEAFEEMGINVQQARVSCDDGFTMEAIAVAEDQALEVIDVTEPLLRAIGRKQDGDRGSKFESC
ncbi:hypothetical protein L6164_017415 [Bauhinia variegata]|uniref:Uncharacterized protein n=1 Tax=Bauhinia variegata TaxID=167791 RepID=A0ACB9N810_BAUVA|nr:hypothetical protein L6164_017415 [Bauhinia variegata]